MDIREQFYKYCPNCKKKLIKKLVDNISRLCCLDCGFIFWNNPTPVVSVVIHKNGEVAMLKRAKEPFKGYWVLPGGYINVEETVQEAVIREAKEEANIEITLEKLIGVYRIDDDPRGINIDIIYSAQSKGNVALSPEDSEFKYYKLNSLPELIAYKHREAIGDWSKLKL